MEPSISRCPVCIVNQGKLHRADLRARQNEKIVVEQDKCAVAVSGIRIPGVVILFDTQK